MQFVDRLAVGETGIVYRGQRSVLLSSTFAIFMESKLPCFTGISSAGGGLLQHPCICGVFQNPKPIYFLL